ncbi:MAG: TonB-dependent receptor [Proteobacteria bacterium]|nr:TonB-dependent receptor [Pseudomonadota bacterium]MBU1687767.1 TonB-dependent receptor [Pseudomonadota bacterium]
MQKSITALCLSIFLLTLIPVHAQEGAFELRGNVFVKGSRKPLEGITVTAKQQSGVFAVTDENGSFSLTVLSPGRYTLRAAALGFKKSNPIEVETTDASTIILYLEPGVIIPDFVVKAERNPDNLSKTIIEGEELRLVAGSRGDPLLALTSLPGVSSDSGEPAIRGSRPGDNIYIVDFLPVGHLFHMGGLISTINGDLVEDFNLYKSAFGPELYVADDVIGSAIDVRLREPRKDRLGLKVHISFLESDFLVEGPVTETQSFYFGARRSYFDLFLSEIVSEEDDFTMTVPVYDDYQGKYLWTVNGSNTLSFQLSGSSDAVEFTIGENSEIAEKDPEMVGDSAYDIADHNQGVVWTYRSKNGTVNKLGLGRLDLTMSFKLARIFDFEVGQENYFLKEQATLRPWDDHEITVGAGYVTSSIGLTFDAKFPNCTEFDTDCSYKDADRIQFDDHLKVNFSSVFAKDRWTITDNLTLIGGMRVTHDDLTDILIADPRLGAELGLADDVTLSAGVGRYHQMPEFKYISEKLGNAHLDKVESDHYVLGAEKKIGQGWSVKTEGFYKSFDKLVTSDPVNTFANNGVGRAYGADFMVRKAHTERLSGWLGFTLSKAERKDQGQGEYFDFDYDRPVDIKLVANYKLTSRWTFGAKWTYHSGSPYTPVVGIDGTYEDGSVRPVEGKLNSERIPDYHSLDLRAERLYFYKKWKMNLYFEIMNAYFRKNIESYEYNEDYSEKKPVYGLPIIPFIGVRAEF